MSVTATFIVTSSDQLHLDGDDQPLPVDVTLTKVVDANANLVDMSFTVTFGSGEDLPTAPVQLRMSIEDFKEVARKLDINLG